MPGAVKKGGANGEVELDSGVTVKAEVDGFDGRTSAATRWSGPRSSRSATARGRGNPSVEGLVESSLYLGTATQMIVRLPDEVRMTVLVPNADEAERQKLPGGGAKVKLSWAPEHMHLVRESPSGGGGIN